MFCVLLFTWKLSLRVLIQKLIWSFGCDLILYAYMLIMLLDLVRCMVALIILILLLLGCLMGWSWHWKLGFIKPYDRCYMVQHMGSLILMLMAVRIVMACRSGEVAIPSLWRNKYGSVFGHTWCLGLSGLSLSCWGCCYLLASLCMFISRLSHICSNSDSFEAWFVGLWRWLWKFGLLWRFEDSRVYLICTYVFSYSRCSLMFNY